MTAERVAYINGEIVPEGEARISIFDEGFLQGEAVYDTARTFNGEIFRLREHCERLLRSARYLRLDPVLSLDEWISVSEEVTRQNVTTLGPNEDFWVNQRIARGPVRKGFRSGSTTIMECTPLPLKERALYYRDGVPLVVSGVRRTPPWAQSPRVKTHSYLNLILANLEVQDRDPDAWPIMLDEHGNLAEGFGCNLFLVHDGELLTPKAQFVLPGISRLTVLELAGTLGIPARETDLDLFDASVADEAFLTSTSLCMCPVATINGQPMRERVVPGPVTARLLEAYSELVGLDIRAQYLANLEETNEPAR